MIWLRLLEVWAAGAIVSFLAYRGYEPFFQSVDPKKAQAHMLGRDPTGAAPDAIQETVQREIVKGSPCPYTCVCCGQPLKWNVDGTSAAMHPECWARVEERERAYRESSAYRAQLIQWRREQRIGAVNGACLWPIYTIVRLLRPVIRKLTGVDIAYWFV